VILKKFIPVTFVAAVALLLTAACTGAAAPSSHPQTLDPSGHSDFKGAPPPAHPRFTSAARSGSWTDLTTGLNVNNDMWNCPRPACGMQEIWANSSSDWGVVSNMAKGNAAVLTYPAVQKKFDVNGGPAPLANARKLQSTFTESMPTTSGTVGEAAYDIWLNSWNTEVMIWVDNQHQKLYGQDVGIAKIRGQKFTVYASSGTSGGYPSGPFDFVLDKNETSGTVSILGAIQWLEDHGFISPSGAGIDAVDFGWEICSTNGVTENFAVSRYSISSEGI
jgi:hypothetical protein